MSTGAGAPGGRLLLVPLVGIGLLCYLWFVVWFVTTMTGPSRWVLLLVPLAAAAPPLALYWVAARRRRRCRPAEIHSLVTESEIAQLLGKLNTAMREILTLNAKWRMDLDTPPAVPRGGLGYWVRIKGEIQVVRNALFGTQYLGLLPAKDLPESAEHEEGVVLVRNFATDLRSIIERLKADLRRVAGGRG